jgi:xylan 1,4-beta-xylosidase
VDESIKSYWSAETGDAGEWIASDLGKVSSVKAIQINYADQDATFMGKMTGICHQYKLYYSIDGKKWNILVDKSKNTTDVPHDYIELPVPVEARSIKIENIHMPTGKFAISGLRIFGNGHGGKPDTVKNFMVLRTEKDKRSAWIKWTSVDNAYAYNIYMGIAPDKLYNCIMVYGANEYWLKAMDKDVPYWFAIEALNENGTSGLTEIIKSE